MTASINHKDLIYLPLGFEYLIKLHAGEIIYVVIDKPNSDFLEMSFKKCDDSVPTLFYTTDVKEFQKGIYSESEDLENNFVRKTITVQKKSKTIHLKIAAE